MFERFTDRARRVIVLAQEESRLLGHNYIGTEHILLGLLHEGEGVAARTLETLGVSLIRVRDAVEVIIGRGGDAPAGHIPFTPRAKKVLEMSLREALQLGHNYIGTEHILLGLIREGQGVAAQVLVQLGVDLETARATVIGLLRGDPGDVVMSGRGSTASTRFASGLATGERRCSFCLRSEERVTRLVRGRGAWICDECVGAAADLVAGAGADPKRLRLRPRLVTQPQSEEAEAAIEFAFETVFGGDAGAEERLALIQQSEGLGAAVEHLMVVGRNAGDPDVWVDAVRFLSTEEAEVHWSPMLVGGGRVTMHGFSVLEGGVWKVGLPTFRRVAAMAGVAIPAADAPQQPGESEEPEPPDEPRQ